jgi:glycosyltransferase involved in cell wall biosynthesis
VQASQRLRRVTKQLIQTSTQEQRKSFEDLREKLEELHNEIDRRSGQTNCEVRAFSLKLIDFAADGGRVTTTQRPRRVLFVDHTAEKSGGEIALLRLIRSMDRSRVTPIVLLMQDGPMAEQFRQEAEVHILRVRQEVVAATRGSLGWRSLFRVQDVAVICTSIWSIVRLMRTLEIDIVHTNSLKADVIGGIAARLAGRHLVWHLRDRVQADYLSPRVSFVLATLARILPHAIITVSEEVRRTLLNAPNFAGAVFAKSFKERVSTVHDGLDRKMVGSQSLERSSGIGTAVGLVGRISPWKGQDVFIKAASIVSRSHPEIEFRIIGGALFGDLHYEHSLRGLTCELGLTKVVSFTGFVDDVPEQVGALDVLVHASTIGEPFGQVIIEGMAAGKPVIASDGGATREVVLDGVTGLLTPLGDEKLLAEAIVRLMQDSSLRNRLGHAGLQRVKDMFLIEKTCKGVYAIYDKLGSYGENKAWFREKSGSFPGGVI